MKIEEIEKKMKSINLDKPAPVKICGYCSTARTVLRKKRSAYFCIELDKNVKFSQIACVNFKKLK